MLPLSGEGSQGKSYYLNGPPRFILFFPELGKCLYVFWGVWCGVGIFWVGGGGGLCQCKGRVLSQVKPIQS